MRQFLVFVQILLLTTSIALGANETNPDRTAATLLRQLPSRPLAFAALTPNRQLRDFCQEYSTPGSFYYGLRRITSAYGRQQPKAALLDIFMRLAEESAAADAEEGSLTAIFALVRPPQAFDVMPWGVLLLGSEDSSEKLQKQLDMMNLPYRIVAAGAGAKGSGQLSLSLRVGDKTLIIAEDDATAAACKDTSNPATPPQLSPLMQTIRRENPGPLWGYVDGSLGLLLPFFGIEGITDIFLEDIQDIQALGLSLDTSAADRNSIRIYAHLNPDAQSIAPLLQKVNLAAKGHLAPGKETLISLQLDTDWQKFYPQLLAWISSHWPEDVNLVTTQYDELSHLTGVHVLRDFFANINCPLRLRSITHGTRHGMTISTPVQDPKRMMLAFSRSSLWGKYFNRIGLTTRYFTTLSKDKTWVLNGVAADGLHYFHLSEQARQGKGGQLTISTHSHLLADQPKEVSEEDDFSLGFSQTPDGGGLKCHFTWGKSISLAPVGKALQALADSFIGTMGTDNPPSYAVEGLRAIVMTEVTYRALRLGQYNRLAPDSYQPAFWLLPDEVDSQGEKISALPGILARATYPDGYPLMGVLFAPVEYIGGRPVDWTRECAFAARSTGADGAPAGIYAVREDGVVYYSNKVKDIPSALPESFLGSGWERITPGWQVLKLPRSERFDSPINH